LIYFRKYKKNPLKSNKNADLLSLQQGEISDMSLAQDGMNSKIKTHRVTIEVTEEHPLVLLANALPWEALAALACEDLKNTTKKGLWMVGRKLFVRVHLGILILQARTKKTDRDIIAEIGDNAAYQAFCGSTGIKNWKCPHATKVEEFRSRLSPGTKMKINEIVVNVAVENSFADPSTLDLDSTVQEANMTYPTDAGMLLRFSRKCATIANKLDVGVTVNLKKIGGLAKEYFFRGKCSVEEGNRILQKLHTAVKSEILPVIDYAEKRVTEGSLRLKWNLKRVIKQVAIYGRQYLKDAAYYVRTHKARKGKTLSLHAQEAACISKGKIAKKHEFGRVFQVGRIGGNFLIALCTGVQLSDKKAVKPMLDKHQELFGAETLESFATDRGYHSNPNVKLAKKRGITEIGIQKPGPVQDDPEQEKLRRRRAGIEPLLGHAKRFGLERSKMKGDKNTHGSGFTSIMGFNLSQLERKLKERVLKMAC
jgi:hypothetical protein